jgi:hypothetical protein
MPDNTTLQQVADAYNAIHASIIKALGSATDDQTVADLMQDDKAAYAAYKRAMAAALDAGDPVMANMLAKLKAATGAIDTTEASLKKIEQVAARIDKAVGALAKLAAMLA